MSTLREAVTKAANDAECKNPAASWAGVFIASLRQSGYWIAPVEPTWEMNKSASLATSGIDDDEAWAARRDAYIKESGQ